MIGIFEGTLREFCDGAKLGTFRLPPADKVGAWIESVELGKNELA